MGEDAKMPKELEKFEDYYMRTMEITGSRDNFPKDPQLVKDVINLFLQQNPRVSQVDIATEFELSSSLFSRFLRTDNVKSKPEWNRVAYILGLNIDLARYIKDTRKLIELVGDWQLIYYGSRLTCFVRDTFDIDGDIRELSTCTPVRPNNNTSGERNYECVPYNLGTKDGGESWNFQYFKGEDVLASDIILNLFANTHALKAHIIIVLNCEQAFEDLKQTFRRKDWRNSLQYYSMTVLRVDDEISTIINEYSDGDLGLKKRSEQGSGTSTVPSATPQ